MHLIFEAKKVNYNEALGGDIIQVTFDKDTDSDPIENPTLSLTISVNYEFPPCIPTVEWYDGQNYDGGETIKEYKIEKTFLYLKLMNGFCWNISFQVDNIKFGKIKSFLLTAIK